MEDLFQQPSYHLNLHQASLANPQLPTLVKNNMIQMSSVKLTLQSLEEKLSFSLYQLIDDFFEEIQKFASK